MKIINSIKNLKQETINNCNAEELGLLCKLMWDSKIQESNRHDLTKLTGLSTRKTARYLNSLEQKGYLTRNLLLNNGRFGELQITIGDV